MVRVAPDICKFPAISARFRSILPRAQIAAKTHPPHCWHTVSAYPLPKTCRGSTARQSSRDRLTFPGPQISQKYTPNCYACSSAPYALAKNLPPCRRHSCPVRSARADSDRPDRSLEIHPADAAARCTAGVAHPVWANECRACRAREGCNRAA